MNIKTLKFLPIWAMALAIGFAGCNNKDDKSPNVDEVLEDAFYLTGEATGYEKPDLSAKLIPAKNEVGNVERSGFYDGYIYLEANKNFSLVDYVAGAATTYGGALSTVAGGVSEEPAVDYLGGSFEKDASAFKVSQSGLYHVFVDKTLKKIVIVPVSYWSPIGDLSGWADTYKLDPKTGASKDKVEFEATNVNVRPGGWKLRHTSAWKVPIATDGTVKGFANYGGNGTAADSSINPVLVSGGSDLKFVEAQTGAYTINFTWQPQAGYKLTLTRTGNLVANPAGSATFKVKVPTGTPATAHVGVVGNFADNSWGIDNPVEMTNNNDGTYSLTTNVPADFQYKYVVSADGTAWSWDNAEDGGNREMAIDLQATTDEVAKWSGTPFTPVNAAGSATFTVKVPTGTPATAHVGVVGNFADNSWGIDNPTVMTRNNDGTYSLTADVPADFQYKYVVSADGIAWSWDNAEDGDNRKMPLNLQATTDEVTEWNGTPFQ
ncbi:MAG: hypothetical protein LBL94_12125 [Prevotellaceae bacterium]|jgi:hypothetical protein|nr:hypothetical protein [Prevotellaceae bacterium]